MKINFSAQLLDLDDNPIPVAKKGATAAANGSIDPKDTEPMTLAYAAKVALAKQDPQRTSAEHMIDDMALALRVRDGGEIEITEAEAKIVRDRIATLYGPISIVIPARAAALLKG